MPRKTQAQKEEERLDQQIESAWYRLCSGVQVSIMDIPKIFRECREALTAGMSIDGAIIHVAEKYRQNSRVA